MLFWIAVLLIGLGEGALVGLGFDAANPPAAAGGGVVGAAVGALLLRLAFPHALVGEYGILGAIFGGLAGSAAVRAAVGSAEGRRHRPSPWHMAETPRDAQGR
jgi:hypothetical protein